MFIEINEHYETYQKALRNGFPVLMKYLKVIFFGPPRSGKSTTRRRLVREIVNLKSHAEPSVSTGVTETNEVIIKRMTNESAIISKSEWRSTMKLSDDKGSTELNNLAKLFYKLIHSTSNNNNETRSNHTVADDNLAYKSVVEVTKIKHNIADKMGQQRNSELSDKEIDDVFEKLKRILQSESPEELAQILEKLILINMADVGDQPAFLDMLPALTIGPALYLLFFRLDQNLKQSYPVQFRAADSEDEVTLDSSYCFEEIFHQCLASIACYSCHSPQEKSELALYSQASSSALIFGTFKDEVSSAQISEIESTLQEMFTGTKLYKEGLLLKASNSKMLFTVDNLSGTFESEISHIQENLEGLIKQHFPAIPIPGTWLMFRILLHLLKKPIVNLTQCKEIANRLKMSTPVEESLWFFHHNIGSLMHYSDIPSMKDVVICDPQVIFDSISKLIISKFRHSNRALKPREVDDFLQKGIFKLSHIKHETKGTQSDVLDVDKLVDLLLHLNILAEITPETDPPSLCEREFIMPTTLKYASEGELKKLTSTNSEVEAEPLMIHFEYGFVPFGVFCVTMAHLIKNSKSLQWQLHDTKVMKNYVKFSVVNSYYAILVSRPQYIEIHVERHPLTRRTYSIQDMCNIVKETVVKAMRMVISNMKYRPFLTQTTITNTEPSFDLSFTCQCGEDSSSHHLMKVHKADDNSGDEYFGECPKSDLQLSLSDKQLVWFTQVSIIMLIDN